MNTLKGWKLAPIDPTPEMIAAMPFPANVTPAIGVACYQAMLNAAPPAPAAQASEPHTPNASLPPLGEGPRVKIHVTVEVPSDWEQRLDMQWVLEREIHADRWSWNWPQAQQGLQAPLSDLAAQPKEQA